MYHHTHMNILRKLMIFIAVSIFMTQTQMQDKLFQKNVINAEQLDEAVITITYFDSNGNKILPDKKIKGRLNDNYDFEIEKIPGYKYIGEAYNLNRSFRFSKEEIRLEYKKKKWKFKNCKQRYKEKYPFDGNEKFNTTRSI